MKRVILLFILLLVGCATRNEDLYSDTKIQVLLQVSEFADQNVQNGIKMSQNLVNGQNKISQGSVKSNNKAENSTKSTYNSKVGGFAEVSKNGQKVKLSENGIQNSAQKFTENSVQNSVGTSAETETKNLGTARTLSEEMDIIDDVVFYVFDERGVQQTKSVFSSREDCSVEIRDNGRYNIYALCNLSDLVDLPETMSESQIKSLTIPHQSSYDRLPFVGMTSVEVAPGSEPEVHIMLERVNSAIKFTNNSTSRIDLSKATVNGLPSRGYLFNRDSEVDGVTYDMTADAVKDEEGNMVVYSFYVPKSKTADVEMEVEATVTGGTSGGSGSGNNTATTVSAMNFAEQLETGKMATAYVGYLESGNLKVGSPDNWGNVGSYSLNGDVKIQVIGGTFTDSDLRAYSGGGEFSFVITTNSGVAELVNTALASWVEIRDNVIIVSKNDTGVERSTQIAVKVGQTNVGVFNIVQSKGITFTAVSGTTLTDGYVNIIGGVGSITKTRAVKYDADDAEMNDIQIVPTGDVVSNTDGIVIDINRDTKTITAIFIEVVDAEEMDEDGIEVPVAFIDPNGEIIAKVTFTQRPAKITFVPARLSNVDFREGDIETTVTTEDNQTWAVYGNITEAGGTTASWIKKTSPTSSASSGAKIKMHVTANNSSTSRTAYVRVKSYNTISKRLEIVQSPSYGVGTISASECWSSSDNTLKAYSLEKTYTFTFTTQTAIPDGTTLTVDCSKGSTAGSGITASKVTKGEGENTYTFTLTVPASKDDAENDYSIDIEANDVTIGSFTVKTPVQPKFANTTAEVWGGVKDRPDLKKVSYYASDWDLKDFTTSNKKIDVAKDVAGKIVVYYAETMTYNDAAQSATIAMNLNGGNKVTFETKQSPIIFNVSKEDSLKLKNVAKNGATVSLVVNTSAGTGSSSWKVAKSTQSWITTSPEVGGTETNASGASLDVIIAANNAEQRTGQFVLESQNTTSQSFTVTQLANFTATIQSITYGSGNPVVFEANTLKAFSVAYDYTVNIKTSAPASSERIKVVSKTADTVVKIKSQPAGSNDTYSFVLAVPANETTTETSSSFDITIDGNVAYSFTVIQAKKTSILVENKSTYSVIGGLASANGTFVASIWDILESNYVTSSNTTAHAVSSLSATGTFKVAFKSTLTFNEETSNATITLKGRDGVNRATATVSQTPVKLTLNPASIVFENGQPNQTATVTVGTTNDGTILSGLTISPGSGNWFIASVSGNKVIVKTTAENDIGKTRPPVNIAVTYKGTTIQFTITQNCDFNPYQTINIGGIEWMRYNLGKSRLESGGPTYATKLPSECTDDPIRTKSHGRFYQWDVGNKSWESIGSTVSGWDGTNPPTKNNSWLEANDPCPENYRISTIDEFTTLRNTTSQTNGGGWNGSDYGYVIFTSGSVKLEFPSVGYRNNSSGTLSYSGTYGRYWSSSQYDETNGCTMGFNSSSVSTTSRYDKTNGFNVRCVRKE